MPLILMILQKQQKITLQSLGKEKLNEVENLPVLYNQELADLIEKCQQPVDMFIDEPIEEPDDDRINQLKEILANFNYNPSTNFEKTTTLEDGSD